jgi:hypothetical protein
VAEEQTPTETSTTEATAQTETAAVETAATETAATETLGTTALGGGEETAETEAAPEAVVPETYELAAPEGFEKLDPDAIAAATPVFKELGLTNEQANRLMPVAGEFAKKIIAERDQQFLGQILDQRKAWLETARADAEIGGNNWDGTMRDAARFLDQMGAVKGSPLRVALDDSGFGNHPELIRVLAKGGKAIGEDDFVRGDANAAVKPKSDAELFYPETKA